MQDGWFYLNTWSRQTTPLACAPIVFSCSTDPVPLGNKAWENRRRDAGGYVSEHLEGGELGAAGGALEDNPLHCSLYVHMPPYQAVT